MQARGFEVALIHLLSPDEEDPPVGGDLKLVDIETGQDAEITLDVSTVGSYVRRLNEWRAELAGHCASRGIHYIPVSTGIPWERLVMQTMRARGLVK